MKITNKHNLTEAFIEAVTLDDYDRGDADFTCTQLLAPGYQRQLQTEHAEDIVEDASERVWALLGTAVHAVLERTKGSEIKEERLEMPVLVDGKTYTLSAKIDNLSVRDGILTDYKITSVWGLVLGKEEWGEQLNIQRLICEYNDYLIEKLQIQGIWKDWNKRKAMDDEKYPQAPSTVVPIEIWDEAKTLAFIQWRIHTHLNPSPCSDKERWYKMGKWAVMKKGRKSAVKLFDEGDQAAYTMAHNQGKAFYVEHRPGRYPRCEDYCNVRQWCKYYE